MPAVPELIVEMKLQKMKKCTSRNVAKKVTPTKKKSKPADVRSGSMSSHARASSLPVVSLSIMMVSTECTIASMSPTVLMNEKTPRMS